jgi:16S rRNA (uracil1498-N3)-methyltransferase
MHVFYAPDATEQQFILPFEETIHCLRVLRFRSGDNIVVTNGKGLLLEAVIEDENPTGLLLRTLQILINSKSQKFHLHIAISPLKNVSRFEWFIEKAAEFRISEITPLICKRTEKKNVRTDRLRKIATEAAKQSKSEFLPFIHEAVDFKRFIEVLPVESQCLIASCGDGEKLTLHDLSSPNLLVLIGPEGDFSDEEISLSLQKNCKSLSLGSSRLRTETAGVFVASSMYYKYLQE